MSDHVQNKLFNYEEQPPASSWDRISQVLDQPGFAMRLQEFTEEPPSKIWSRIESQLPGATAGETVVRPVRSIRPFLAAASLIALIILAFLIFRKSPEPSAPVHSIKETDVVVSKPDQPTILPQASPRKNMDPVTAQTPKKNPSVAEPDSRYMMAASTDGNVVRLSKKVKPVFDCADNQASKSWKECAEQIRSLQQKMATSFTSPTADITSILAMLETVEEK